MRDRIPENAIVESSAEIVEVDGRNMLKVGHSLLLENEQVHTTLTVRFRFASGDMSDFDLALGNDGDYLAGLELHVNGEPVFIQGMVMHEDSKRLHTVCRRNSPEIDTVDW